MTTLVDFDLFLDDPKAIQRKLGRRAAEFTRTGKVLEASELLKLYEHRHQLKPSKAEAKLILASMLFKEVPTAAHYTTEPGLRTRRNELGWFWFRQYTTRQLADLLYDLAECKHKEVNTPAGKLLRIISAKKASAAFLKLVLADPKASKKDAEAAKVINDVHKLAPLQSVKSLPKLRQIAKDTSLADWLRFGTVEAIGRLKQPEDLPLLRSLTTDATPRIRRAAVEALVGYKHPDDAAVIRELTRDRDENVRWVAIEFIGCYGQPEDRDWLRNVILNRKYPHRALAVNSLAQFKDPRDLPLFRKLTSDREYGVQLNAVDALGMFQDPADVALLKKRSLLSNAIPIDTLMTYPAKLIVGAVRELAKGKDNLLRSNLACRLGDWHHPEAPKILRRLTRAVEFDIRATAVVALGAHGQAQDLPRLRHMSQWDTEMVRREAVWAVAKFRKREDIPFLKEGLHDEAPAVRTVAAMALTRLLNRADLERFLKQNHWLRFEPLVEFDFALYAPGWLVKSKPRIGDDEIGMELQMMRSHSPEW